MSLDFYAQLFTVITLSVDAIKQALKPLYDYFPDLEDYHQYVVWASLVVVSLLTAFGLGSEADMLANAGLTQHPEALGIALTGFVLVFGANIAHNLFVLIRSAVDLVKGWRKR